MPTHANAARRTYRFIPGARLWWLLALGLPLLALPSPFGLIAVLFDLGLLLATVWSARQLAALPLTAARQLAEHAYVGTQLDVLIELRNVGAARVQGRLRDDVPDALQATPNELTFALDARDSLQLRYRIDVTRRGRHAFGDLHLRLDDRLGLASVLLQLPAAASFAAYPAPVRATRRLQPSAATRSLHGAGLRSVRHGAQGGDFERLREYAPGDAFRELDWKATAKRLRPITRVRGQEQRQHLVIALDAGLGMGAASGPGSTRSKLDVAIDAALSLAEAALHAGDNVALAVVAGEVLDFVPMAAGKAHYRRVRDALFALQARPEPLELAALHQLMRTRVRRRALLMLLSDLQDAPGQLEPALELRRLRDTHLPVCITLSDPLLLTAADSPVTSEHDVYQRAAAVDALRQRAESKARLERAGVAVVEARAAELCLASVAHYLEQKQRHAL